LRALVACVLLSPPVPMLFMGEEFAASTPFLYFCDFAGELARAVVEGRHHEFRRFAGFANPLERTAIPDPIDESTFLHSKLNWAERDHGVHHEWLDFYRALLKLRRDVLMPWLPRARSGVWWYTPGRALHVHWPLGPRRVWCLQANLSDVPVEPALVAEAVDAAHDFLADAATLGSGQLGSRHAKVVAKLRDLIARVGDQSNLILDPGLDSFYTMYAVVVTLPELTDRLMDLSVLSAAIAEKKTLSVEDRAQFMILMGQFESARQALSKAVDSAYRGNPDGRLKAGLDADYRAANATLTFLAAGMKGHVLQRDGVPVDARAAAQLRDAGLVVIDRVTKKAAAEPGPPAAGPYRRFQERRGGRWPWLP
jgi:hypothetical protein